MATQVMSRARYGRLLASSGDRQAEREQRLREAHWRGTQLGIALGALAGGITPAEALELIVNAGQERAA